MRFFDCLCVNQGKDAVNIVVCRIIFPDEAFSQSSVIVRTPDGILINLCNLFFKRTGYGFIRITPAGGKQFDPVVNGRVVAGCNHHAVGHLVSLDSVHHKRRRRGSIYHQHAVTVGCEHLCQPVCSFLGEKTPVIPYHNFCTLKTFLVHPAAEPCCKQTEICLGKIICYHGTPAACSETDHVLSLLPIVTSARQMLPGVRTGSSETGFPSARIDRTPFSTPSGLIT